MAPSKGSARSDAPGPEGSTAVRDHLKRRKHRKAEIELVRKILLGVDPHITEGIKWNTPSFYCDGWFATVGARPGEPVRLVLHRGAKVRDNRTSPSIVDPLGLLTWHATDRASTVFAGIEDVHQKKAALVSIVRQWIGKGKL